MQTPILNKLAEHRIFCITWTGNAETVDPSKFEITEYCDMYFSVTLTRAELTKLGHEILAIALNPSNYQEPECPL